MNRYALGLTPNPLQGIATQLRKCAVPTRIFWGMSDRIFSGKSPDYLAGILARVIGVRRTLEAKLFFQRNIRMSSRRKRSSWSRAPSDLEHKALDSVVDTRPDDPANVY